MDPVGSEFPGQQGWKSGDSPFSGCERLRREARGALELFPPCGAANERWGG